MTVAKLIKALEEIPNKELQVYYVDSEWMVKDCTIETVKVEGMPGEKLYVVLDS